MPAIRDNKIWSAIVLLKNMEVWKRNYYFFLFNWRPMPCQTNPKVYNWWEQKGAIHFIVGHHNLQLNLFRSLFSASSQLWYCHLPVIKGIDQPTQNSRRKLFRYFTTNWVLPANMLSNPVFFAHFRFLDENIAKGTTDPRVEFCSPQ